MSRFLFHPTKRELLYAKPRGAEIPASAYRLNDPPIFFEAERSTSPLLIALLIVFIVIFVLALLYLFWLWFIRDPDESATSIFDIFRFNQ